MRPLVLIFALLFPLAAAATPFEVGPVPAWVEPVAPDLAHEPQPSQSSDGIAWLLLDHQLDGSTRAFHAHVAKKVLAAEGIEMASELAFDWDPSHEKLRLHYVRIHRGGKHVDALQPGEIRVIQQESDLAERMFNGTLTALAFLKDVRAGDVIEYAFTVEGANPVFEEHFGWGADLGLSVPVHHLVRRLRWPAGERLHVRPHGPASEPVVEVRDGVRTWRWELRDVAPVLADDGVPGWFDPYPWVQFSTAARWSEVADWALRLHADREASKELDDLVEKIRAGNATDEERLLASLRFVQDEIRYLGIEIGPHSHRPHRPAVVLERRFGDCKDKSLLLVTMLEKLGIESWPALVNTEAGRGLDQWQPSVFAFDHVVVKVRLGGRTIWVEPTRSFERGPLDQRIPPPYERALVIAENTEGLEEIPPASAPEPTVVVEERYLAKDYEGPVDFEVTTTYSRWEADRFRYRLATTPLAELARGWLNYYAEIDPEIEPAGEPQIEDDPARNVLVIRERYRIPGFWREKQRDFYASVIAERLDKPRIHRRSMPLALSHPLHVRQLTRIELPAPLGFEPEQEEIEGPALRFRAQAREQRNAVVLDYRLQSLGDQVEPAAVGRHLAAMQRVRDNLGFGITPPAPATEQPSDEETLVGLIVAGVIFGGVGLFSCAGLVVAVVAVRRGRRPVEGMSVDGPVRIAGPAALRASVAGLRCGCGAGYAEVSRAPHQHGQRAVTELRLRCASCGAARSHFVEPWSEG